MPVPEITVTELADRVRAGAAIVFDVRNPDEYEWAHVAGATLVPLGEVPERIGEFPVAGEVLIICKTGGRSAVATEFLRANGVDAVNVTGGTLAWIESGQPVETGGAR